VLHIYIYIYDISSLRVNLHNPTKGTGYRMGSESVNAP